METTQEQFALARSAKKSINTASTALKNQALEAMASQLLKATEAILAANQIDMGVARGKISEVMLDRLFLDQERIAGEAVLSGGCRTYGTRSHSEKGNDRGFHHYFRPFFHQEQGKEAGPGCTSGEERQYLALRL